MASLSPKKLICSFVFAWTILFSLFILKAAEDNSLSKIDVIHAVDANEVTLSATSWAIGDVRFCFDGDTTMPMRTANINPAFVQIAFQDSMAVSKIRVLLEEPGCPNGDKNDWWVETADNKNDLLAKSGNQALEILKGLISEIIH